MNKGSKLYVYCKKGVKFSLQKICAVGFFKRIEILFLQSLDVIRKIHKDVMMKPLMSVKRQFFMLCGAALLSACGGGGSSSNSQPTETIDTGGTTTTTTTTSSVQTTVSKAYVAGTLQRQVQDVVNNERARCGFGVLNQHDLLDQAATNHAKYLAFLSESGHTEVAGKAMLNGQDLFTGLTTQDRVKKVGYSARLLSGQVVTAQPAQNSVSESTRAVRALLSAPYHLIGMMSGAREMGVSQMNSVAVNPQSAHPDFLVFKLLLGSQSSAQGSSNQVLSYPCDGTAETLTGLFSESPNPIPNGSIDPIAQYQLSAGQPILIQAPVNQILTISQYQLQKPNGDLVDVGLLTEANPQWDPNNQFADDPTAKISINQAVVLPLAPLSANTTYRVIVEGTRKAQDQNAQAVSFKLDFHFTTGAENLL